ncbi:conserved hypothetical protein [Anaeromyxobacter dehalogenans 2CP-1]|uniref:Double Cache domain-containing protein n=1 Tax=Anaeromyxobacter dehalogenans (strain ATCC BAA-258 / DSM 21875 / 2CP-1) TaxID=455488 RepID=B8J5J7_ANAD2|nr:cache domain-containing protein [Anaeromyxobacter dehalogenans]ACL66859.1 conserved hypothetical protein [Anaeromyxobacter dehalogenans 2CP-1]
MRSVSLELRLLVALFALCAGAAFLGARLSGGIVEQQVEQAGTERLRGAEEAFASQERAEIEKLSATLDALLSRDDLRQAFVARDRERLLALSAPLFETMRDRDRITHWYFIAPEPDATVFLRVHRPELRGDKVDRVTFRRAVETADVGAGKELGRTAFALRVVRPWLQDGKVVGYLELAEEIDHFLGAMKSRTGDDYGILVKKRFLDQRRWAEVLGERSNTWNDRADVVVVDTTTFTEGIIDYEGDLEVLPDEGVALGEVVRDDRAYMRGIFPLRDAGGRKVGGLFVLHDFTAEHGAARAAMLRSFMVLIGVGAVLAAILAAMLHYAVFARLRRLERRLEREAALRQLPPGRVVELTDDEIGRLEVLLGRALFPSRDELPRDPSSTGRQG